jgi:cytochrome b subunit of formate dehydrogenase
MMNPSSTQASEKHAEDRSTAVKPARLKPDRGQAKRYRKMVELVERVQVTASGRRFARFNAVAVVEHWGLIFTFSLLAVTGLLMHYAGVPNLSPVILLIFRDIDQLGAIHNVGAIGYSLLAVFHAVRILNLWLARRDTLAMAPSRQDYADFIGLLRYLFKKGGTRPAAGRYSIEEKITYWWLLLLSALLILSAAVLWAPVLVSRYLPGVVMPAARTLHAMSGLLAVVTILPWHLYHTMIRTRNFSIFNGVISERRMQKEHPLEYQQIMAAVEELGQIQAQLRAARAPVEDEPAAVEQPAAVELPAAEEQPAAAVLPSEEMPAVKKRPAVEGPAAG